MELKNYQGMCQRKPNSIWLKNKGVIAKHVSRTPYTCYIVKGGNIRGQNTPKQI